MTDCNVEEVRARLGGRRVLASVSGGKDSTAMCLHLQELGVTYEPVFMDTGWENAETYRYLRDELPQHIGPIRWLRSTVPLSAELEAIAQEFEARMGHYSAMVRWILKKGMFSSGRRRFCTQELKIRPMAAYIESLDVDAVNTVGVRAEESSARAALPEWEEPGSASMIDADVWRPLIRWTVDDVIAIHHRHGVTPNRNYLGAARRVGCWPCIRSTKAEIRNIADTDPDRIAIIRDLEAMVGKLARDRAAANGATLENGPAWFQAPVSSEDNPFPAWPIDKVVEWSRTARGGRQFELFAAREHELGCTRWGLCEMVTREQG